jgi:pimeloyl-ACP methyl ester carboxylesterase
MPTITTDDGTSIAYRTFGSGPLNVLFVHGWMVSGAVFNEILKEFDTEGLRLIVPDLRGTGGSGKPDTGYTLERHVNDVLAVADAAEARSFVVVGHSMGGQLAQGIAATQPDRVRGMVLLTSVPAAGMALPDDAKGLFRGSPGSREMQGTILGLACKQLSEASREALLDDAAGVSAPAIQEGFDAWTAGGFVEKLGDVRAPTLVVATDDPFLPPDFLRQAIVSQIKGARLAVLPGPGHYPQVERPRETAALLQAFFAGLG